MTPPATTAPPAAARIDADDEFELDLRVIESAAALTIMTCDTSDNCGSTCSTTACNTTSNDPF